MPISVFGSLQMVSLPDMREGLSVSLTEICVGLHNHDARIPTAHIPTHCVSEKQKWGAGRGGAGLGTQAPLREREA